MTWLAYTYTSYIKTVHTHTHTHTHTLSLSLSLSLCERHQAVSLMCHGAFRCSGIQLLTDT